MFTFDYKVGSISVPIFPSKSDRSIMFDASLDAAPRDESNAILHNTGSLLWTNKFCGYY